MKFLFWIFFRFVNSEDENITQRHIKYFSLIKLINTYTNSHLSTSTDFTGNAFEIPTIYSKAGSIYENGWNWLVNSPNENMTTAHLPVECEKNITLINAITRNYISLRKIKGKLLVVPTIGVLGPSSLWVVECEQGPLWKQYQNIRLRNAKYGCYLSSTFTGVDEDDPTLFDVKCSVMDKFSTWKVEEGIFL